MNVFMMTGHLVADATVNTVSVEGKDDRFAVNFSVATNDGYMKDGNWVEETEYHDCVRFLPKEEGANTLAGMLTKGRFVEVEGAIKRSSPRQGKGDHAGKSFVNVYVDVSNVTPGAKPKAKEDQQEA